MARQFQIAILFNYSEEKTMNMKLMKVTTVFAKIVEIGLWMSDAALVLFLIGSIFFKDMIKESFMKGLDDGTFEIAGFETKLIDSTGSINTAALLFAIIAGIVAVGFTAMIFRNITLIFKSETPFCADNVRMVREIGIFAICIPAFQIILSIATTIALHAYAEIAVDLKTVLFGFVVLCLSQYFQYGASLEKDMDGLI